MGNGDWEVVDGHGSVNIRREGRHGMEDEEVMGSFCSAQFRD